MKSRLLAGSAAALVALVGVILVFSYAQGADQRAVQNLAPVDVLVVKTAIPAGTSVDAMKDSLDTVQRPGSAVPQSALHTLADSTGKVAAVDLVPGETLVSERLVAPDALKSPGDVKVPAGLQEVSFQLEPQRVVGGLLAPGDHIGIFISMSSDKQTTELAIPKVLVTMVQRAPQPAAGAQATPNPSSGAAGSKDTSLPTGSLMLTVAVSDVDASKIVFAAEFEKIWLSKEPLDAKDSGPTVIQQNGVYR
ncbi:Flp pilus assembly protein CpaB [Arthrobacter bambusae]|uniref:Flp pilus assembly protein CpaB n=1 Tax=Arthrobacter bambusae TaxID=1338426 RepID=UPI00278B7151|nr:RcpC/CpaB family pilus assembly protein [Arthrobacter bambusae]MDQ0031399.1 pilus assembly protein CpaB [Arthrobacter bambusae]MDQ0099712.1 pilus assembly protein CpaB [Arthrobacter bambusae]